MKEKFKNCKYGLVILIAVIIVSIPMFWKNLDVYTDDGVQHIVRAYLTGEQIKAGENTTVLSRLSNGFGYSWNLFYGQFSSFLVALFYIVSNNVIVAYKFVLVVGLLFSGITMYYFVKKFTDDKNVGLLASIMYMIMPYHLNDLYIRNSLGEFLSFIFMPLVFLGLYNLFNKEKKEWLLVVGAVGLIITHNIMTAITAVVAFFYLLINIKKLKDKSIRNKLVLAIVFIVCISSFYWMPLLETSLSNDYAVYQDDVITKKETVVNGTLTLRQLFFALEKDNATYVYELGLPILVMLCFTVATIRRLEPKMKKNYIFFLVVGLISCFMATKYFPWKYLWKPFRFIQFPYRFLTIANFCFAIVCSINMGIVIRRFNFKDVVILSIISIIYVCALNNRVPLNDERSYNLEDDYNTSIGFVTGRNTDCLVGMGKSEYLPASAYNNEFYVASREKDEILVTKGSGEVTSLEKNGNKLTCKIEVLEDDTEFEFPYIYYPGYTVKIDGLKIPNYENENGFLSVSLNKFEKSDIVVEYTGTSLMNYSKVFSVGSLIIYIVCLCIINKISDKQEFKESAKTIEN